MATTDQIIGKNISKLRDKRGYQPLHIAQYLGISKTDLLAIEAGKKTADIEQLERLAELFGIDAYDFYESKSLVDDVSYAFKANQIQVEDLKSIASFMKIIRNYQRMKKENETKATAS